jgi:leader peptidase (prepilin peptidase)/N-methyltransferase
MLTSVVVASVLGAVVARSIVAEADAHRRDLPDSWYGPECAECGSPLDPILMTCTQQRHRQRRSNVAVLVVTVLLSGFLPLAVPSLGLMPAYLVFLWSMILLTVTDLDTKLIPNRILGPVTVVSIVLLVLGHIADTASGSLVEAGIGGVAYFAVMLLLALIVRGGLGFGDVKLAFLIGVFAGYLSLGHVLVSGIGAFLLGGLAAVLLLVTRRSSRKDAIPFGPFMTSAAIVTVFFGQEVINWYLG